MLKTQLLMEYAETATNTPFIRFIPRKKKKSKLHPFVLLKCPCPLHLKENKTTSTQNKNNEQMSGFNLL